MGRLIRYESCPQCGSQDNLAIFSDGYHCFTPGCNYRKGNKHPDQYPTVDWLPPYKCLTISDRNLSKKTCNIFDIRRNGKIVGFPFVYKGNRYAVKYRDFSLPKNHKGHMMIHGEAPCTFFGWQAVSTASSKKVLAIAGGEFDAASVTQLMNVPCVSPPNGDDSIEAAIKFHLEDLLKFNEIILIPDNDSKGQIAFRKAAELLRKDQVKIVSLSMHDPNEYVKAWAYEEFRKAYSSAERLVDNLLVGSIKSTRQRCQLIGNDIPFFKVGSRINGMRTGEVTLLLGRTMQGKSTMARWISLKLAEQGYKTGMFSLEEQPDNYGAALDDLFSSQQLDVDDYVSLSSMHGTLKLDDFKAACFAMVKLHQCQVVVVDNLTAAADPKSTNESLNQLMLNVNKIAAELNIHIICCTHASRECELRAAAKIAKGEEPQPPNIGDGFGSSFLEKFAWNYLTIHVARDGITRIDTPKTRYGKRNKQGTFMLAFSNGTYTNINI